MTMKYKDMTWGKMEAVVNKLGGMDSVERFLSGELTIKEPDLLRQITKVSVPGAKKFIAKNHFKTANIGYTGDNFDKFFLNKVEENVEDVVLVSYNLKTASLDAPILAELGDRAETSLVHLYKLLSKQVDGKSGVLLTNSYANIFYIRGTDGNLWAVHASWYSDGWDVDACSGGDRDGWDADYRVFSRDS